MDPQLLRAFVCVVDSGGFTAAARALNRTQSAVSLQIKRLEEQIGEPLFQRTTRRVTLTECGGALMPYARRILRLHDEAALAVDATSRRPVLRFGIPDEQARAYLPRVIPAFGRQHPDVLLELQCDLSTRLVERLEEGDLDLAMTIRHGPSATGEVIGHERLAWVAREDFVQDRRRALPLAVYPEGCIFRAHALAALTRIQRRWRIACVSTSPTGINLAVQAGRTAAIKARRSIPPGCRVLDGEPGIPPLPRVEVEFHRSVAANSEAVADFVRLLMGDIERAEEITALPRALAIN